MGMNCKILIYESEKYKLIYFKFYEIEFNFVEMDEINELEKKDIYEQIENLDDEVILVCSEENSLLEGEDGLFIDDNEDNERDFVSVDEDNEKVCLVDNDEEDDCLIEEEMYEKDCLIENDKDDEEGGEEKDDEEDDDEESEEDDIEWEGGDVVFVLDEILSYMLKICLFYVL